MSKEDELKKLQKEMTAKKNEANAKKNAGTASVTQNK